MGTAIINVSQVSCAQNHMATTFRFTVSCEAKHAKRAKATLEEALSLVGLLEQDLSEFIPSSCVARLNAASGQQKVKFSHHAWHLLQKSLLLLDQTRGAFNCLAKSTCASPRVKLEKPRRVSKSESGVRLGFGAIGKGYALDQVRVVVEQAGFTDYYLSAGGSSIIFSGFAAPGQPWRWGWGWERTEGDLLGVELAHRQGAPIAIGVSGTLEQGFHIRNPKSGRLAAHTQSALVGLPSATEADAFSTALFVLGWERRHEIATLRGENLAMGVLQSDHRLNWNERFSYLWGNPCGENSLSL